MTHAQWDSMERLLLAVRDLWVTVQVGPEERAYVARPVAIAEDLDLAVLRLARAARRREGVRLPAHWGLGRGIGG